MRTLDRNKQYIYYATATGKTEIVDAEGYKTGQFTKTYTDIIATRQNISAARGTAEVEQFGQNTNYSKTAVTEDLSLNINENSIAWVDLGKVAAYSATETYSPSAIVYHDSSLYCCKTATTGTWDATKWLAIPHNYIVVGVAKSLNSVTYALREVQVNG